MALPSFDQLVASYSFVARRVGVVEGDPNTRVIGALLAHAKRLATTDADEPAALFYALVRYPRAFPGAWRAMTTVLTLNAALSRGFDLGISGDELAQAIRDVHDQRASYDDIRAWFEQRRVPR